ncbi:hypothetical protein [Cellulomonas aerilata]|uniref:Phosphodiesterase n=1 Tax=Cellulomonas aerilata TaxID=515326 RepID=A0A512DB02_9CELL|nr:hypothetical protein [Cellulomonas aerilata]GEO33567.1 hypothetical protein CAE01nite_12920 [Cellulomonas aerilata]
MSARGRALRLAALAATALGGVGLGVATGTVAALRHDRPMHAVGRTYHARLERTGTTSDRSGVAWIDQPRAQGGLVRFSRGAGLPARLPDVQGVAIRLDEPGGHTDLLLSSSGLRGLSRFVLVPRRSPLRGAAGSLMPFRGPHGPLLLAVQPAPDGSGRGDRRGTDLTDPDLRGTRWHLLWSGTSGPWREVGVLTVGEDAGPDVDRRTRFGPVTATPPGLPSYRWARLVRDPAYRAAQLLGRPGTGR